MGWDSVRRNLRRKVLEPVILGVRSFRETVLNALADRDHLVYCRLPEGNFFIDPSDRVVGSWLMWHGGWQKEEIAKAINILSTKGRLPPNAIFVDCGANIGTQTVYAMRAGCFASAIAFEPEPRNFWLLEMNMAANGLSETVRLRPEALSDTVGETDLYIHPRNKGAHSTRANGVVNSCIRVRKTRLDEALSQMSAQPEHIGLIWCDVEGAELDLLNGMGRYIGVPLVIEYCPDRLTDSERRDLSALIASQYGEIHLLHREKTLRASDIDSIDSTADLLLI